MLGAVRSVNPRPPGFQLRHRLSRGSQPFDGVQLSGEKQIMVKDATGKETAVYWNDTTEVSGDEMKEGAMVHWEGAEENGKMWATRVHAGAMPKKI